MKVAVTGATGFVGRHVLQALAQHPGLDIVASGSRPIPALPLPAAVRYVPLDLGTPAPDAYERLGRPDTLVHLAWAGLPNYRALRHFETELPRQFAFLQSMVRAGLRSLLVTGTCYEYGMTAGELCETAVAAPANPYAHAKSALREQLQFLRAGHPFELTWARLFYMHGSGQPATSLLPQLAAAVARGDSRFGMSRGEQLRDYLPVEDVARHIAMLALHCPGAGTVNVCSGQPISVRALVEQVLRSQGWKIELDLGKYPYPDYEPMAFWGSRARLDALLGKGVAAQSKAAQTL